MCVQAINEINNKTFQATTYPALTGNNGYGGANFLKDTKLKVYWDEIIGVEDFKTGNLTNQIITESGCNPKIALNSLMQQYTNHPEIKAVIGPGCSGATKPSAQTAGGLKLPLMSFGASSPTLSDQNAYPWFARLCPSDAVPMDMFAVYMKAENLNKIGFLGDQSGFCSDNFKYFKDKYHGTVTVERYWAQAKLTLPEATEILTQMTESGVKIFFLCNYAEDDLLVKQAAYDLKLSADNTNLFFAIWPPPYEALLRLKEKDVTQKADIIKTHNGWSGYSTIPVDSPLKANYKKGLKLELIKAKAKNQLGCILTVDDQEPWCEYVYDIVYHYAHAIQNCITAKVQPEGVQLRYHMLQASFNGGITGDVKLQPNGDRKLDAVLFRMNAKEGYNPKTFVKLQSYYTYKASTDTTTANPARAPKAVDGPVCANAANGKPCSGPTQGTCGQKFLADMSLATRCACKSGCKGTNCDIVAGSYEPPSEVVFAGMFPRTAW
jgi:ABC-type branched-subunit amino acid transport system substrate-binding protein